MNKLYNPFLLLGYAGHEYFCGRDTERKELISALRNGRNITLMSPRRMGKTGLIKDTFYQIGKENKNAVCLYMDIFATKSLGDFVSLHHPMAESKELKSLLMKLKDESGKASLKLNIQKIKIMASSPITSWQIGEKWKQ